MKNDGHFKAILKTPATAERLNEAVLAQAHELFPAMVDWRRHAAMYPETAFDEFDTQQHVGEILDSMGISWKPIAGTGIIAEIKGDLPDNGKVWGLAAEMDALPVTDMRSDKTYQSRIEGKGDMCNHGGHRAMVLGALAICQRNKHLFAGRIRAIFHPAEEAADAQNKMGMDYVVEQGGLDGLTGLTGLHASPELDTDTCVVAFFESTGTGSMAGVEIIEINFTGTPGGGHGAMPWNTIDPIMIAMNFGITSQQIVSRRINLIDGPAVFTIGKIETSGFGAHNIIPESATMMCTLRTFNPEARAEAMRLIKALAEAAATPWGATASVLFGGTALPLVLDPGTNDRCRAYALQLFGSSAIRAAKIRTGADSFATAAQHVKASFWRLATGSKRLGIQHSLHSQFFDIDERSLENGAALLAFVALKEMAE